MSIQIRESVAEAPVKQGNRWRVIVARPGKGSSGTYSEDLFRRDAEKLIPKGAQSFINHGERDPEKMIGVFPEGGSWDEDEKAVVAELQVFEHWKSWVEEVAPYVGMSLYAMGEADQDGNVTEIFEDAYNGADLVSRPGLKGSQIADKLYEAAVNASDNDSSGARQEETGKETNMDIAELKASIDALAATVSDLVTEKKDAEAAEAQVEANEAAVTSAIESYASQVQAIDEADLLPVQVESLRARAAKGEDVTEAIAEAKTIKEAALSSLRESQDSADAGRQFGGENVTKFGAWK